MASSLPTFAAGVSIPSSNFGRNLATKTNSKTTVMARITRPDHLATCVFASPPSLLIQRNGVTTRRGLKTTVDAYPENVKVGGIPVQTNVEIKGGTTELVKGPQYIWEGDINPIEETKIPDGTHTFTHLADPPANSNVIGSVGAIAYKLPENGGHVVVAWANSINLKNTVYTQFIDPAMEVNWNLIQQKFNSEKKDTSEDSNDKFTMKVDISPKSSSPKLTATLSNKTT